jgi:hypothetical protein
MERRLASAATSDYPEFAEFLVRCGIDSISLNPDTVIKTTDRILQLEKEMGISRRIESEKSPEIIQLQATITK